MNNDLISKVNALAEGKNAKGVGLCKKESGGVLTDEVAVCFMVDKKKDISELSAEELIPSEVEIDGEVYKTDVQEGGDVNALICYNSSDPEILRLQGDPSLLTPLKGGQEIFEFPTNWTFNGTSFNAFLGTLGFFAVDDIDGRVVGVTNTHVAVSKILNASERDLNDSDEPYNTIDPITWNLPDLFDAAETGLDYNPGALSRDGSTFLNTAQRLKRHIPFTLAGPNYVDCCLLIMDPTQVDANSYQVHQPTTEPAYTTHLPFASTAEIDNLLDDDPTVYSTGRTTGPKGWGASTSCQLQITGLMSNIPVNFSGTIVPFTDVIQYRFRDGSVFPADGGDSGSALIAEIGGIRKIIGIVFAGSNDIFSNTGIAYACRIDRLADEIQIREWDAGYVLDTSVPTAVVVEVPQTDPNADEVSFIDGSSDRVYQAGLREDTP